jgi:protein O-GlcNAc transferase
MGMNDARINSYLDQARAFVNEGKTLHAIQVYRQVIVGSPVRPEPYLELASLYEDMKQFTAAERILSEGLEQCSQTGKILYRLGMLCLRFEQYERAVGYLRPLEKTKLPQVHFNLGVAYFSLGNLPRAEKHLAITLKYDPQFPKINETIGDLLIRRKAFSEAVRYLRRGIQIDPYSSTSHYLLGLAYQGLYDWKNASEEFATAIDMDPKDVRAWESCGKVLINLGRLEEAESYLRKALELDPKFADTLVDYGQLSLRRGKAEDASIFFSRALELHPGHPEAINGKIRAKVLKQKQLPA